MTRKLDLHGGDVHSGHVVSSCEVSRAWHPATAAELEHLRAVRHQRVELAQPLERRRCNLPSPFGVAKCDRVVAARDDLLRIACDSPPCHLPHGPEGNGYSFWMTAAIAWPNPMHIVAMP